MGKLILILFSLFFHFNFLDSLIPQKNHLRYSFIQGNGLNVEDPPNNLSTDLNGTSLILKLFKKTFILSSKAKAQPMGFD